MLRNAFGALHRAQRSCNCIQSVHHSLNYSTQSHKHKYASTQLPPPSPGRGLLGRAANFDTREHQGRLDKWKGLLKFFGFLNDDDRLMRESSQALQSCVNQTAIPELYQATYLVPDFRSQQALLLAHVWMIHCRLRKEGEEGKIYQELIFDRLWEETLLRIRHQNVSELLVNKHLAQVQQVCFNACLAYDEALKRGRDEFEAAVCSHLLPPAVEEEDKGQREESTRILSQYLWREINSLSSVDAKLIVKGSIPWGSPPQPKQIKGAFDCVLIGQKFGDWRTALDIRGKMYFWNCDSRLSSWELPADV